MSELSVTFWEAIPSRTAATIKRISLFGDLMRAASTQAVEAVKLAQQTGESISSNTAKLTVLSATLNATELKPLADGVLARLSPRVRSLFTQAQAGLASLASISGLPANEYSSALNEITSAIAASHHDLALREQTQTVTDLTSVLAGRGYAIQKLEATKGAPVLVKASLRERVVCAKIDAASGAIELDMAGFAPGDCTAERQALMTDLAARGYRFRIGTRQQHNRRDGGQLIKEMERSLASVDEHLRRIQMTRLHEQRRLRR